MGYTFNCDGPCDARYDRAPAFMGEFRESFLVATDAGAAFAEQYDVGETVTPVPELLSRGATVTGCSICGGPIEDAPEEHHDNERRGDNDPDNLRDVHRRCHMEHHENDRAVDDLAAQRYGPRSPSTGPPGRS